MKKSFISLALAVALVLAFAATASATSAKTWNYQEDYYSWGSTAGAGLSAVASETLGQGGSGALKNTNPTNPGVHANYQTTTAKCGICHSVHRAKAGGVKLLNATVATCAGCHAAGTGTVTTKLVSWQAGGPHSSGTLGSCSARSCHADNPHGANGSAYKIFSAKLLSPNGDVEMAAAISNPASSGITVADLNADVSSTWTEGTRSAVRTGYTCNQADCHTQTMLPVIEKNWAEQRGTIYPAMTPTKLKTGHLSLGVANAAAGSYTGLDGCVSCHDQTDAGTTSGFTFPHSQTAYGASNTTARSYLWMTRASNAGLGDQVGMLTTNEKSMDGACLKCHRASNGTSGIGLDQ